MIGRLLQVVGQYEDDGADGKPKAAGRVCDQRYFGAGQEQQRRDGSAAGCALVQSSRTRHWGLRPHFQALDDAAGR